MNTEIYEAWQAGKKIEFRDAHSPTWRLWINHMLYPPFNSTEAEFRIRPDVWKVEVAQQREKKTYPNIVRYRRISLDDKLSTDPTGRNLKLTFEFESGDLISAEILK